MKGVLFSHNDVPTLFWDYTNKLFAVLNTEHIPCQVYDHLWPYRPFDTKQHARIDNNIRIVSRWVAEVFCTNTQLMESLMHQVYYDVTKLSDFMKYSVLSPWSVSIAEIEIHNQLLF